MGVLSNALAHLLGRKHGGVTHAELEDLVYRNKFSDYFVWNVYDPDTKMYENNDGTYGFVWECLPLVFAAEKSIQLVESLMRMPLPPMSVLQFLFHADSNIKPFLDGYRDLRQGADPLVQDAVENYCQFLESCVQGIPQMSGIPLRNYRLIVSLKIPKGNDVVPQDVMSTTHEALKGMDLVPRLMSPGRLLEWLRRLFNDEVPDRVGPDGEPLAAMYNDMASIGKQALFADSPIECKFDHMQIGKRSWRCMTPKQFPANVDPLQTKELFGGIWGLRSENEQHRSPFLYALNIIYDKGLKNHLRHKCELLLKQESVGSWARSLSRRQEEAKWAVDKADQGEVYARVMPVMWFYGDSFAKADDALKAGKRIWENAGYIMQEDKGILSALFLSSLPMGLRANKDTLNMLERDVIADTSAIANILPIQGDFAGSYEPVMILQGRTGQIAPISIFSSKASNYNGFCAAKSGGGKSFTMNMLLFSHYTAGVILRIIDIGGSYKKLCHIFNGVEIDFDPESEICLNPFSNIVDIEDDLSAIANIIMQMVYSSSDSPNIEENEHTLAKEAVTWAYKQKGAHATVDDVHQYLDSYPKNIEGSQRVIETIVSQAHAMAFNMRKFTSHGSYGRYFVGEANFDISRDRFLLLELGALESKKDLFKVIVLLVLDAVTRDLYLSDRTQPRMVLFDEAYMFLSGQAGNVMMRNMIELGFRRSRKHFGCFLVVTQSLLDRKMFGPVGEVIWSNADYKIFLESGDYDQAVADNLINYDPFTVEVLKSIKRNETKFSEIFFDTPYGSGVGRISVDPFSYYLFTSSPKEVAEIESLVVGGMDYREAIHEMVRKYRS